MIIWSGLGFLIIPIVFGCVLLADALTGQFASNPDYFDLHGWPMGVGILVSAVICWFLGRKLSAAGSRTLIDPKTGTPVVLRRRHSVFFIPMQWWAIILIPFGLVISFTSKTPEQVRQDKEVRAAKAEQRAAAREFRHALKENSPAPTP